MSSSSFLISGESLVQLSSTYVLLRATDYPVINILDVTGCSDIVACASSSQLSLRVFWFWMFLAWFLKYICHHRPHDGFVDPRFSIRFVVWSLTSASIAAKPDSSIPRYLNFIFCTLPSSSSSSFLDGFFMWLSIFFWSISQVYAKFS